MGWGVVEFSKVLLTIIIMKPSRYLKGYSAKTCIETTNSKTRSKKVWNNIQINILFESLELHQRFKMRLCYVTERCSVFPSEYCKWPGGPFPCLSQRGFSLFYGNGLLDAALDDVIFVNCSLCTDVPPPSGKMGRGDSSPDFSEGEGTSVHRLRQLWVDVMLCYVIICLEDLDLRCCYFWPRLSEMSSSPRATTSKPKNVCHHCNICYSWQWAQDDVARQAAKGYGLIGKAMKKIVVASIEASSQVRPCIDI